MTDAPAALAINDVRPEHAEAHALLQRLLVDVQALRADVAAINARLAERERIRSSVPRFHVRTAGPLLREISAAVGDDEWSTFDLCRAASNDRALLAAITAATGPVNEGSSRRLGQLLSRIADVPIDGHMVERVEYDARNGCIWRVRWV